MMQSERNADAGPDPAALINSCSGELAVSWQLYEGLVEHLALQIHRSGCRFDQVVALSRGGLRIGDSLSRLFARPLVVMAASSYCGQGGRQRLRLRFGTQLAHTEERLGPQLLLVDDMVDSGTTLQGACRWLWQQLAPQTLHTAVLWRKGRSRVAPDYWAMELPGDPWILQPFERRALPGLDTLTPLRC